MEEGTRNEDEGTKWMVRGGLTRGLMMMTPRSTLPRSTLQKKRRMEHEVKNVNSQ